MKKEAIYKAALEDVLNWLESLNGNVPAGFDEIIHLVDKALTYRRENRK